MNENIETTEPQPYQEPNHEDEIDLIALAKKVWEGRRTIIKLLIIFSIIGLVVTLTAPKEFTASTTIIPQATDNKDKLGGLGGLATMAGFNMNIAKDAEFTPTIYPKIISSMPFQKELLKTKIKIEKPDTTVSLFTYFNEIKNPNYLKGYTIGLPGTIFKSIRKQPEETALPGNNLITVTLEEKAVIEILDAMLSIEYNDKDGYVTITGSMHEALAAAQLVERAQKLLQDYITKFKIKKAKSELEFIQESYKEKKQEFENIQNKLAIFRDKNKNVTTSLARTEEERLNSEYIVIQGIYSELAKQLEKAKINVKKNTPVFSVIDPVFVPIEKSKPKRSMILIIWMFLGVIVGAGMVIARDYIKKFKQRWNEI